MFAVDAVILAGDTSFACGVCHTAVCPPKKGKHIQNFVALRQNPVIICSINKHSMCVTNK
jgi:hypothetical protein